MMTHRTWMGVMAVVAAAGVAVSGAALAQPAPGKAVPKEKDKDATKSAPRRGGGPQVGDEAPQWAAKDAAGKEHKLADYKGKVVVMDFWATWCGPCKRVMPGLQKLHEEYKDDGLVIIGMNFAERGGDPVGYMKSQGFDYLMLLNSEQIARDYGVGPIPSFYVIDKDGKLIYRDIGADKEEKLGKVVRKALGVAETGTGAAPDKKEEGKPTDKKPEKPANPGTGATPDKPGKR